LRDRGRLIYYKNTMKIFEFAFNPKKRKDRFFEVFSYEPKSPKEKPRGSLYVIGELNNALEFNSRFLRRLSTTIQTEYHGSSLKGTAPALKAALKSANQFLLQESKKGNVDWLGNLHCAILVFVTVKEKKTIFHLAKTGNLKVFLRRQGTLVDVGKNLDAHSSKQPGKVFGNVVSGSLVPHDSVFAQSKEVFDILLKEKSLSQLGAFKEAKQFREFFSKRSRMLSQTSGVLTSFVIEEEIAKRSPINRALLPRPQRFASKLARVAMRARSLLPKPKLLLSKPKLNVKFSSAFKKQAKLVLLLFVLLLLGALLF